GITVTVAFAQGANVLVIRGATLIDGSGRPPIANATVVIEGNKIREAGPSAQVQAPAGAAVVNGAGKFLIPGLIDAHVRLRGGNAPGGRGAAGVTPEQEREGIRALHSYLYAGVTTIFDAGNRPAFIMSLREKERTNAIVSPRIFATGGTVASPGGHG